MAEVGIGGRGNHMAANVGELLHSVGESDDFRRAHESAAAKELRNHYRYSPPKLPTSYSSEVFKSLSRNEIF